jgi:hypothetical protein
VTDIQGVTTLFQNILFIDTTKRCGHFNLHKKKIVHLEQPLQNLPENAIQTVPESRVNCVTGCVMLSHTTPQHVCAGHTHPVQHQMSNMSQYDTSHRSTEIIIKCCAEMLLPGVQIF